MIRTVKRFDRGDHWLIVDTRSGSRVTHYESKVTGQVSFPPPQVIKPSVTQPIRLGCVHNLGPLGRDVAQSGCTGCGQDRASIWDCELFGDVAPLARGVLADPSIKRCIDCHSYQKG